MSMLLLCGIVGPAVFVLVFLVDGATRPGYRPAYHPVSALALGDRGWIQTANFVGSGTLVALSGIGIAGVADSLLLGGLVVLFGVSLVASGAFPMDPMRGYPPGTKEGTPEDTSRAHELHDWAGMAVFGLLPVVAAVAGFVLDGAWRWYSAAMVVALVVFFLWFGQAWEEDRPRTGLVQRLMIVTGWAGLALLCWHLLP